MKKLRTHLLIAAGALAGIVIIGTALWLALPQQTERPEDLLPADRTLAFLRLASAADLTTLTPWFPLLRDIPTDHPPTVAALVTIPSGDHQWIFFDALQGPVPLAARSRSPEALQMLRSAIPPLSASASFRSLVGSDPMSSHLFLANTADRSHLHALDSWVTVNDPIGVSLSASGTTLSFPSMQSTASPLPASLPLAFRSPLLVVALSDPLRVAAAMRLIVAPSVTTPVIGTLEAAMLTLWGNDFSATYHLLPLLRHQSILAWGREEEKNVFLLQGQGEDALTLTAMLMALHRFFAQAHPHVKAEHTVLAPDKIFDDVREETTALEQTSRTISGWQVEESNARDISLITAQRGSAYIITTGSGALEDFLSAADNRLTIPASPGDRIIAGGTIDATALRDLIQFYLPEGSTLPPFSGVKRWSVTDNGEKIMVRLMR